MCVVLGIESATCIPAQRSSNVCKWSVHGTRVLHISYTRHHAAATQRHARYRLTPRRTVEMVCPPQEKNRRLGKLAAGYTIARRAQHQRPAVLYVKGTSGSRPGWLGISLQKLELRICYRGIPRCRAKNDDFLTQPPLVAALRSSTFRKSMPSSTRIRQTWFLVWIGHGGSSQYRA